MSYWNWKEGEETLTKRNIHTSGRISNLFLSLNRIGSKIAVEKSLIHYLQINVNHFCYPK